MCRRWLVFPCSGQSAMAHLRARTHTHTPAPTLSTHMHTQELDMYRRLSHPNIVDYLGFNVDKQTSKMYIFLEYVPGTAVCTDASGRAQLTISQHSMHVSAHRVPSSRGWLGAWREGGFYYVTD